MSSFPAVATHAKHWKVAWLNTVKRTCHVKFSDFIPYVATPKSGGISACLEK